MFVSNYEVNIDSKGRVSVPPAFRSVLGGRSRLILWPSLDGGNCLEGSTEETFQFYTQTILRSSFGNINRRALINVFASQAHDLKLDDTGRIKLPEKWVAQAEVTDQVLFVGALDKFQIWELEAYEEYNKDMFEILKDEKTLGLLEDTYKELMATQHQVPATKKDGEYGT